MKTRRLVQKDWVHESVESYAFPIVYTGCPLELFIGRNSKVDITLSRRVESFLYIEESIGTSVLLGRGNIPWDLDDDFFHNTVHCLSVVGANIKIYAPTTACIVDSHQVKVEINGNNKSEIEIANSDFVIEVRGCAQPRIKVKSGNGKIVVRGHSMPNISLGRDVGEIFLDVRGYAHPFCILRRNLAGLTVSDFANVVGSAPIDDSEAPFFGVWGTDLLAVRGKYPSATILPIPVG